MSAYFCGNPKNHEAHETANGGRCLGVNRPEVKDEVLVEKFDPNENNKLPEPHSSSLEKSNEIRTTSTTGGMKGVKPQRYDLIPIHPLDLLAELYGVGAEKYEAHNFRKGYEWSKSYAAAMRHMTAFWNGEDIDPEMNLPHVTCAAFHMFALAEFMREHPEFDDRFKGFPK